MPLTRPPTKSYKLHESKTHEYQSLSVRPNAVEQFDLIMSTGSSIPDIRRRSLGGTDFVESMFEVKKVPHPLLGGETEGQPN